MVFFAKLNNYISISLLTVFVYVVGPAANAAIATAAAATPPPPPSAASSAATVTQPSFQGTKSYRVWKAEKADQIMARIGQTKTQIGIIKSKKAAATTDKRNMTYLEDLQSRYEKQLTQEQWNLEVARDLSVTDYIVLYLAGSGSKTRYLEAASQMGPVEIAEMMEAYSLALGAANTPEAIVSSPSPPDAKQAKSPVGALNGQR